ncbi:hypothetical protein Tco_1194981 [Tanacetum coccineum]
MTPRSCLRWKPTGKIFKTVGLRWVPTGKIFTSSTTKVDSEPSNGSNDDITNQYECKQTLDVSAGTLNIHAGTSLNPTKEGLRVCSELGIHDHSNELSSLKLVPKVVPPADKTATSRQELELLFHHHITMLRSTSNGNYKPTIKDKDGKDVVTPYEKLDENQKKILSKNDEAKMVLYNVLPKKEYERIFMCDTGSKILDSLINYFISQWMNFFKSYHLGKLNEGIPSKWQPKVTTIEESKDLSKLSLDELVGNLNVYEVVLEKDLEIAENKKEKYKSLALKARQVLSDDDTSSSDSNDEEYAMAVRDFKKFFRRRGKFVRQPYDDKRNFQKIKEDKKEDRRCFKRSDPNHFC